MTILDACVEVLESSGKPLSAEEIMHAIREKGLYEFRAKDPSAVMRATLRKHLREGQSPRIKEAVPGRYEAI